MTAICAVSAVVTASITIRRVVQSNDLSRTVSLSSLSSNNSTSGSAQYSRSTEFFNYHRRATFAFSSDAAALTGQRFRQSDNATEFTVIEQLGAEVEIHMLIPATATPISRYQRDRISLRLLTVETNEEKAQILVVPLHLNAAGDSLTAKIVLAILGDTFRIAIDAPELSMNDIASYSISDLLKSISASAAETRLAWEALSQMSIDEPAGQAIQSVIREAL